MAGPASTNLGEHLSELPPPKRAPNFIPGLDLLRFVAASMVVAYHLGFFINISYPGRVTYHWPGPFTWFGFVGVEIFFTISGIVITFSALRASAFKFLRSRLTRLVPGTLICATLTLLSCALLRDGSLPQLIMEWLRSAFLPLRPPFIDMSYWTLPIEIVFYAVIWFLISTRGNQSVVKTTGCIGMVSAGVWMTLTLGAIIGFPHAQLWAYELQIRGWLFLTLIPHGCFFGTGVLLNHCINARHSWRALCALMICIVGGVAESYWHALTVAAPRPWSPQLAHSFPGMLWLTALVYIYFTMKFNRRWSEWLGPALPLVRWAGLITYPLYLLHQRCGSLMILSLTRWMSGTTALWVSIAAAYLAATVISMYGEPKLREPVGECIDRVRLWLRI